MATLTETMVALQWIGEAVTMNDEKMYLAAVEHARSIGCTQEQIKDAYDYRNQQRMKSGKESVSFPRA